MVRKSAKRRAIKKRSNECDGMCGHKWVWVEREREQEKHNKASERRCEAWMMWVGTENCEKESNTETSGVPLSKRTWKAVD